MLLCVPSLLCLSEVKPIVHSQALLCTLGRASCAQLLRCWKRKRGLPFLYHQESVALIGRLQTSCSPPPSLFPLSFFLVLPTIFRLSFPQLTISVGRASRRLFLSSPIAASPARACLELPELVDKSNLRRIGINSRGFSPSAWPFLSFSLQVVHRPSKTSEHTRSPSPSSISTASPVHRRRVCFSNLLPQSPPRASLPATKTRVHRRKGRGLYLLVGAGDLLGCSPASSHAPKSSHASI